MRPVREITAEEENFRFQQIGRFEVIKRDPVKPEPEGTIVLMAFRVTGYSPDCDGSLMAKLEHIGKDGEATGWEPDSIGLYPDCEVVCTLDEFRAMFDDTSPPKTT